MKNFGHHENLEFLWQRVENMVGKGENACYSHFLLFFLFVPQCFPKPSSLRLLKVQIVW